MQMNAWLNNTRDAIGMGLLWAVAWAPVGVLAGTIVDPHESMDEPWIAVGMLLGFLCGVLYITLLRLVRDHGRRDELSLPRAAAWGALSGLLVPLLFVLAIAAGLGTWRGGQTQWSLMAIVISATLLGSALSAAVSLVVTRWRNAASTVS